MLARLLRWGLVLLLLLAGAAALAAWHVQRFLEGPIGSPEQTHRLVIERGENLRGVARELEAAGMMPEPLLLVALGRWTGQAARIQAGEYRVRGEWRPRELLERLVAGDVVQHELTLVEGWTIDQVRAAVAGHDALEHTLGEVANSGLMAALGLAGGHPEGRFLPDTYRFPRGTTDRAFLRRAARAMEQVLDEQWERRDPGLPLESPDEALVLASIVEKETAVPAERARIAGVFVNRLRRGMRLQTDPTVIYGLGADYAGDLTREHLRRDTPYNTYTRGGLPPTPIAIPGRAAIHAALHPAETDALYFVARGDGSHVFSETLEAHNRAVRKYQINGD